MPDGPTKTTTHLGFLDVLRGVAILWVFVFHSLGVAYGSGLPHLGPGWTVDFADAVLPVVFFPLANGFGGVAIFFVISGFCIHLSHLRARPGDWWGFFVRRFFRIYPPYLAALLLFAFCFPKTRLAFGPGFDWGQLFSHLFLAHNFRTDWFFGINGSFWTIAVEAQLYLLYPVLTAVAARYGWGRALWLAGGVEAVLRACDAGWGFATGTDAPLWLLGLPFFYWGSWAVGAVLADAYVKGTVLPFASWRLWPWVALALVAPFVRGLASFGFPCCAVATAIIVAREIGKAKAPATDAVPWIPGVVTAHLRQLGVWSYAVYLLHQPVIRLLFYVGVKVRIPPALQQPWVTFAACVALYPLIVLASALFRRTVELPSIAWGRWVLARPMPKRGERVLVP